MNPEHEVRHIDHVDVYARQDAWFGSCGRCCSAVSAGDGRQADRYTTCLHGWRASSNGAVAVLQELGAQEEEDEELYYVVEDPSQPECAISGERFERFFDPEEDKWCFKDAVILYGEDADK